MNIIALKRIRAYNIITFFANISYNLLGSFYMKKTFEEWLMKGENNEIFEMVY